MSAEADEVTEEVARVAAAIKSASGATEAGRAATEPSRAVAQHSSWQERPQDSALKAAEGGVRVAAAAAV